MLSVSNRGNGFNFTSAIGITKEFGEAISDIHRFRIGSITKLFTATVILQLAEEGAIKLEEYYFDLINEKVKKLLSGIHLFEETDYSPKITLLHLLRHSSGLRDYFSDDKRFLADVMENPLQAWNWKSVMEKYFAFELNKKPAFVTGNGFHYSDTNYMLLGILIEQLAGKPLHQVYKDRITTPLGLTDTFLEFYELPDQAKPTVYPYYGIYSLENVNTSFDWGGGGLISTMNDLNIFIHNLIKGNLFQKNESLELMMQVQNSNPLIGSANLSLIYGIGIQKKEWQGYSFLGHYSAYGAMLFYEPEKDISIFISINQAAAIHKAEWLMKKTILACV